MNVNSLVTHKKFDLGIGCIAKVLKNSVQVNFGKDDVKTCKKTALTIIDTSKCKTIDFKDLQTEALVNSDKLGIVIIGNVVHRWVGIGMVAEKVVTIDDLRKYRRAV